MMCGSFERRIVQLRFMIMHLLGKEAGIELDTACDGKEFLQAFAVSELVSARKTKGSEQSCLLMFAQEDRDFLLSMGLVTQQEGEKVKCPRPINSGQHVQP